jgi:glycosyltransferase involved in cell wall biosynthesis
MSTDPDAPLSYSVVVPVYNEANNIGRCLNSLLATGLEHPRLEILVVDGISEDDTRAIVREYAESHDAIRLLKNPERTTPTGFNTGFEASQNDVVVLLNGHSHVDDDFFERMTHTFEERAPDADVVGGRMIPVGESHVERAVAAALTTPIGSSSTRFEPNEGYVKTVNFGGYRRYVWEDVGAFDPSLPRGQDYEYNRRVREHRYRIYQNPEIAVYYAPRSTYHGLARQYYGNGLWKSNIYRRYDSYPVSPEALTLIGGLSALVAPLCLSAVTGLLAVGSVLYLATLSVAAVKSLVERGEDLALVPQIVCALATMHIAFALGLARGTIREPQA